MKIYRKKRKGVTLTELMVVLAVLGIVMGIAIPNAAIYLNSYKRTEARYNHQTLVYCMREWSLENSNKAVVPGNFTVRNTQDKSVVDYVRYYNNEYYEEYLDPMLTGGSGSTGSTPPTFTKVKAKDGRAEYELADGKLTTTIKFDNEEKLLYEPLKNIANKTVYIKN